MYGFDALPDGKGAEIYMPLNNASISDLTTYLLAPTDKTDPTSNVEPSGGGLPEYVASLNKHDCGIIREYRNYFY